MRWALLGVSDESLTLAERIHERGDLLVAAYQAEGERDRLTALAPAIRFPRDGDWESLLHGSDVTAVLVGPLPEGEAERDLRHEQLRKLCQAGLPLLLVHPACDSIVGFELDMIRRDTQSALVAYTPGMHDPWLRRVLEWLQGDAPAELGEIQQVVFERPMTDRRETMVLRQLSRDVLLLLQAVGEVKQVNAMGTFNNLSVQMGRRDDLLVRWNLAPGKGPAKLALIGARGRMERELTEDGSWLEPADATQPADAPTRSNEPRPSGREAEIALAAVENSSEDSPARSAPPDDQRPDDQRPDDRRPDDQALDSAWFAACRSREIAEVVPRCLARGRTIELFYDDAPTEEATFKGMMAAGSCGILMLTLLILVFFSVVEGIRLPGLRSQYERDRELAAEDAAEPSSVPPAVRTSIWLRLWPVYPFALFLMLQLLKLVFRKPVRPDASPRDTDDSNEAGPRPG